MPPALQGFAEAVTRHSARGWARDPADPARRVQIQAMANGRILAEAPADLYRGDVHAAGLGDGNCGFVLDLTPHAPSLLGAEITLRDADTFAILQGTPTPAADPHSLARFLTRWDTLPAPTLSRLRRMMRHRLRGQGVSVVALTEAGLPELRASLKAQLAGSWELIRPGRTARHTLALVVAAPAVLERDALWHLLQAAADPRPAAFLWDHLRLHPTGAIDLVFHPAFAPDSFRSRPDPGAAFAVRSAHLPATDPAELILRLSEHHPIAHLPRLLHRTAAAPARPAVVTIWPDPPGRTLAIIPTRNNAALLRTCLGSLFRTRAETPLDIVVIDHDSDEPDTKAYLRQIAGLVRVMPYSGPFHFAAMNNQAVARYGAEAETLLFLNNDTEALAPGWLARMRGLAARPDVGAVGALLLYGDRRVQHAGVVIGYDGSATHAHAMKLSDPAIHPELAELREMSAVTAACMMTRREAFLSVGGFDEAFPVGFNDTDLCLRLRAAGLRILQDNGTVLLHHESRTRRATGQWLHPPDTALFQARHAALIRAGDPFYNPNLRLDVRDHEPRPDCLPGGAARLTFPGCGPIPPGAGPAAAVTPASAARRRRRSSG
jgi:GT2 family glycosyltransferase